MPETPPTRQRATILVVDDTPQNLSLMSDLLESKYNVKLAPGGARALKIATTAPPDLVLLDIMMPEMDGYEVCRALKGKQETKDIPVIFLTAMDTMEDEEKGLLAGAVDYITKPISPHILLARVHNQLALKMAADELREQNRLLEQEKIRAHELLSKLKEAADKLLEQNRLIKHERDRAQELLRTLGNAYQAHGQLDMAWDKLRQFPIDEALMDDLYRLALEFEHTHQPEKAIAVFRHMAEFNPQFRDLEARLTRAESPSRSSPSETGLAIDGRRTLGRYQIDKELGQGAMGVVFQGVDPKIGRVVAIKTLALSKKGADSPDEVKDEFFREAESAGRLTHPNIVAIYDVGEEHGLAYIAMEFLKGRDLTSYARPDSLLELDKVLSILARVAEGLAYAHENGVVHRDIKPANIVYEPDSDSVKVTDFGIASIASSAHHEGDRLAGTPNYMSPEQVDGKTIDGRSDLYSLGVTLYLLASGHQPFQAATLPQLMFKIANEPPVDILTRNPELPNCVVTLIQTAMAKNPADRYQSGIDMARAMNQCRRSLMVFA